MGRWVLVWDSCLFWEWGDGRLMELPFKVKLLQTIPLILDRGIASNLSFVCYHEFTLVPCIILTMQTWAHNYTVISRARTSRAEHVKQSSCDCDILPKPAQLDLLTITIFVFQFFLNSIQSTFHLSFYLKVLVKGNSFWSKSSFLGHGPWPQWSHGTECGRLWKISSSFLTVQWTKITWKLNVMSPWCFWELLPVVFWVTLVWTHNSGECFAPHMPANANEAAQNTSARNQDYYCMLWTAVLLLLLWKHNSSITENKDLEPHPDVIPQPVSLKLVCLWIVSC